MKLAEGESVSPACVWRLFMMIRYDDRLLLLLLPPHTTATTTTRS